MVIRRIVNGTYREWDVSMIQLRLSQGLLDGRKGLYDEDNGIEIVRYIIVMVV